MVIYKGSLYHLICDCPWVLEVWRAAKIYFPMPSFGSFRGILDWILGAIGRLEVEKLVIIC